MSPGEVGNDPITPGDQKESKPPSGTPAGAQENGSSEGLGDSEPVKEVQLPPASQDEPRKPELGKPTFEDETRKVIAIRLIWILAGLLLASYVTTWIVPAYSGGDATAAGKVREEVSFILQQAIGPLITLVGTVCGFYFGRKKNE